MAGLSCADALVEAGHAVTVFDKGRGPGGRMSTRRVETTLGEARFDHGAQYFSVRDPAFAGIAKDWVQRGVIARWPDAGGDAYVGVPGMSAVIKDMAASHTVEFGFLVKALVRVDHKWKVMGEHGAHGNFDAVVLAIPAEQATSILSLHDFEMARTALLARSQPCWTALFAFASPVVLEPNIVRNAGPIAWAARNSAKPGRDAMECWVVQANPNWSRENLEDRPDLVERALRSALADVVGGPLPEIVFSSAHRWRYALSAGVARGSLWNENLRLGACGDWLLGPRVECAWLSGHQLASKILETPVQLQRTLAAAAV